MMKKIYLLKVLGIHLLFIVFFLVANVTLASDPDIRTRPSIIFDNINESAEYIQWEIKANENYKVSIHMEDSDGNKFTISFNTNDYYEEYDTSDDNHLRVGIGHDDDYADDSKKIYNSRSFSYLTSKHFSANNNVTYNYTNETIVRNIYITGTDFNLYSITLADNDDFEAPCWQKDASDWNDLNDFEDDGGEISDLGNPYIQFNSSNIHVTQKEEYHPSYFYPVSYLGPGYFGYQQTYYPYGYQQPFSYGWNQPSYGWGQPSYGWNMPYNYGWNQPSYGWNQPYNYAWNQPSSYGWNQPYSYGWNQPYGYGWKPFSPIPLWP